MLFEAERQKCTRNLIEDKTTLFFKNKAGKNYSIISAKYVNVKNTTFIYKKLLQYEIIGFLQKVSNENNYNHSVNKTI